MLPQASVFVGTSVDGFIARPNDDFDFLDAGGNVEHGYTEFFASVDGLVIGRRTYDKVIGFESWPYGTKPVVVLSSRPLDPAPPAGAPVEQMSGSPREILEQLGARGWKHAYIDGGITVTRFLEAGLLQRLIISRVPVLIGAGIPLFGVLGRDILLEHVATRTYESGLVQTEYRVRPDAAMPGAAS